MPLNVALGSLLAVLDTRTLYQICKRARAVRPAGTPHARCALAVHTDARRNVRCYFGEKAANYLRGFIADLPRDERCALASMCLALMRAWNRSTVVGAFVNKLVSGQAGASLGRALLLEAIAALPRCRTHAPVPAERAAADSCAHSGRH
jgi:hypothetical protein